MNYETAHGISKRTVKAIIGAMKLNRSSPRVLAFAPKELMGLGMCHHYTAQGKAHLKQIVHHVRQQDENGKLYNMIFDYAQLIAGIQFPILQFPNRRLPQMTEPFIVEIRKFLARCNMNIVITDVFIPSPLRIDEVNLMMAVMEMEKNDNSIGCFNQVRLYLQVTWLSEICNALGTLILPDFLDRPYRNPLQEHPKVAGPRPTTPKVVDQMEVFTQKMISHLKEWQTCQQVTRTQHGIFLSNNVKSPKVEMGTIEPDHNRRKHFHSGTPTKAVYHHRSKSRPGTLRH
jgi:hypothetical protein